MPARFSISESDRLCKPRSAMIAVAASTICRRRMLAISIRALLRTESGIARSPKEKSEKRFRLAVLLLDRSDQPSQDQVLSQFVGFRSAKARPFAERKAAKRQTEALPKIIARP